MGTNFDLVYSKNRSIQVFPGAEITINAYNSGKFLTNTIVDGVSTGIVNLDATDIIPGNYWEIMFLLDTEAEDPAISNLLIGAPGKVVRTSGIVIIDSGSPTAYTATYTSPSPMGANVLDHGIYARMVAIEPQSPGIDVELRVYSTHATIPN